MGWGGADLPDEEDEEDEEEEEPEYKQTIRNLLRDLIKKFKIIEGINSKIIHNELTLKTHINKYLFLFTHVIYRSENLEILPSTEDGTDSRAIEDNFINEYQKFKYMIDKEESFTLLTNKFSTDEKQGDKFDNEQESYGFIKYFLSGITAGGTTYKTLLNKLIGAFSKVIGNYKEFFKDEETDNMTKTGKVMGILAGISALAIFFIILILATALYATGSLFKRILNALFTGFSDMIKLIMQTTVNRTSNFAKAVKSKTLSAARERVAKSLNKSKGGYIRTNRKTLRKKKNNRKNNTLRKKKNNRKNNTLRKKKNIRKKNTLNKKITYKKRTNKKVRKQ